MRNPWSKWKMLDFSQQVKKTKKEKIFKRSKEYITESSIPKYYRPSLIQKLFRLLMFCQLFKQQKPKEVWRFLLFLLFIRKSNSIFRYLGILLDCLQLPKQFFQPWHRIYMEYPYYSQDQKTPTKGQLISKCLFGVFNFSQKTNGNKST